MAVRESTGKKAQPKAKRTAKAKTGERKDKLNEPKAAAEKGLKTVAEKAVKKTKPKSKETAKAGSAGRKVKITFNGPHAGEVYLAGVFNDWDTSSILLEKSDEGIWIAILELLPGRYEYNFFVDGNWVEDTSCAELVPNCFGTRNSVIVIE